MRLFAFSLLFIFASMLCASPVRIKARDNGFRISKRHRWTRLFRSTREHQQPPTISDAPQHSTTDHLPTYEEAMSNRVNRQSVPTGSHGCTVDSVERAWRDGRLGEIEYGSHSKIYGLKDHFDGEVAVIQSSHVEIGHAARFLQIIEHIEILNMVKQLIAWGRYDDTSGTHFLIVTKKMGDPAPEALSQDAQKRLRRRGIQQYQSDYHVQFAIDPVFDSNSYFAFRHTPGHVFVENDYVAHPICWGHATYIGPQPRPMLRIRPQQICAPVV